MSIGVLNKVQRRSIFNFECATFSEFALASCGLAENVLAVAAGDDCLGMAEDDCCFVAASTLHVHEIAVGGWNESLQFVLLLFGFEGGV